MRSDEELQRPVTLRGNRTKLVSLA